MGDIRWVPIKNLAYAVGSNANTAFYGLPANFPVCCKQIRRSHQLRIRWTTGHDIFLVLLSCCSIPWTVGGSILQQIDATRRYELQQEEKSFNLWHFYHAPVLIRHLYSALYFPHQRWRCLGWENCCWCAVGIGQHCPHDTGTLRVDIYYLRRYHHLANYLFLTVEQLFNFMVAPGIFE